MADDQQLEKIGAVICTGGTDRSGRPLITFPQEHLSRFTSQPPLLLLLSHLLHLLPVGAGAGAAFVVNLRTVTKEVINTLVAALDKLQVDHPGSVAVLYAILPKSKDLQKQLKKQLGLKPSKKNPKTQVYKSILLNEGSELTAYIDMNQLTEDYGGSLPYNHKHTTEFQQGFSDLEASIREVSKKIPGGLDKLGLMLEYDIPTDQTEAHTLVLSIRNKYHQVMRELNLEHTIDECKEYIEKLKSPQNGHDQVPAPIRQKALKSIETLEKNLISQRQELKLLWQQAEARILKKTKVMKYKAKAEKVLQWINDVGMKTVNQDPEIADCLSKAEIFKNHFETGFYSIAKNVVWLSRKIQHKLDDLVLENKTTAPELLKFSRNFQATVDYFKKAVDKKLQVYVNVHSFFLTSQKIPCDDISIEPGLTLYSFLDQMTAWYHRCLRFLPVQLLHQQTTANTNGRPVIVIRPTGAWRAAVDNFLLHHPMPKVSHLNKLKNVLPVIDDLVVRNQARLLIHRIEVLCQLFGHTDGTPLGVIKELVRWRDQVEAGADDITLHVAKSSANLTSASLHQFESNFPAISLGSMSHLSLAGSNKSLNQGPRFALKEIDYEDEGEEEDDTIEHYYGSRKPRSKEKKAHFARDRSMPRNLRERSGSRPRVDKREGSVPRQLDRNNKLRSKSERHLAEDERTKSRPVKVVLPNETVHYVQQDRVQPAPVLVPKLDLSFIDGGAGRNQTPRQLKTKQVVVQEIEEDYGIYGDSDDEMLGQQVVNPKQSVERYISLEMPAGQQSPATQVNGASSGREQTIHPQQGLVKQLPKFSRLDSITDSGITHTQTGTDASALSLNTLGLSPLPRDPPSMQVVPIPLQNGAESQANSIPSHLMSQSLPDLNYRPDGQLELTQGNIDAIVNSALTEEEKLDLMAAICEAQDISASKVADISKEYMYRFSEKDGNTSEAKASTSAPQPRKSSVLNKGPLKKKSSYNHPDTEEDESPPPLPKEPPPKQITYDADHASQFIVPPSHSQTIKTSKASENHAEPRLVSKPRDRKKKQDYGIDVAAWVNKYGYDADSVEAESVGLESVEVNSTDGMDEYVQKLKTVKRDRKSSEEELESEKRRLEDLELEGEVLCQQEVARSLNRTERILKEQEEVLQDAEPISQASGNSPHHRLNKQAVTSTTNAAIPASTTNFDCSASEESGIFTQTSNDSRFRYSESGSELRLRMNVLPSSGRSPSSNEVKEVHNKGAGVDGGKGARGGAHARQLDFKERLNQRVSDIINRSKDDSQIGTEDEQVTKNCVQTEKKQIRSASSKDKEDATGKKVQGMHTLKVTGKNGGGSLSFGDSDEIKITGLDEDFLMKEGQEEKEGDGLSENVVSKTPELDSLSEGEYYHESDDDSVDGDTNVRQSPRPCNGSVENGLHEQPSQLNSKLLQHLSKKDETDSENDNEVAKIIEDRETKRKRFSLKLIGSKTKSEDNQSIKSSLKTDDNDVRKPIVPKPVRKTKNYIPDSHQGKKNGYIEHGEDDTMICHDTFHVPNIHCYTTEELNLKAAAIIDNGSGLCKCGLATDNLPTSVFPAIVGRPKYEEAMIGTNYQQLYLGDAAQAHRGVLKMKYPIEHGIVTDWDDMEMVWNHALRDQMRIDPEEHPIMLTEAPFNPKKNRERMAEIMFESFRAPAVYVAIQAVLGLTATGRSTGAVLDIGDGVSHVVPVYEGNSLPHATMRIDLAGRDLTDYLIKLLQETGDSFTTSAEREIVKEMKEQHCFVASNFYQDSVTATTSSKLEQFFLMPDGHQVSLNAHRFRCPEVLFQPSLIGREHGGIHHSVYTAISKCDKDIREELLTNIVLSGGTTLLPGLSTRLKTELSSLYSDDVSRPPITVHSPGQREYLVWQGGATLSNMDSFNSSWVFKQEYEEFGLDVVHRKCF